MFGGYRLIVFSYSITSVLYALDVYKFISLLTLFVSWFHALRQLLLVSAERFVYLLTLP